MGIFYNTNIVRTGLVLYLDAANTKSYPGSGTTWYDAITTGYNFTLSGPVYTSTSPGYFTFDGNNDTCIGGYNTALDTQTPSVEVWVKTNNTNQFGTWFEKGAVNTQYSLFQQDTNILWRQKFAGGYNELLTVTTTYMTTDNWYQVVGTFTTGSRKLYINGVQVNSDSQTGTISTDSSGMSIGMFGGNSGSYGYYYNGLLSICRIYNKALTAAEVRQNFEATKDRYGI